MTFEKIENEVVWKIEPDEEGDAFDLSDKQHAISALGQMGKREWEHYLKCVYQICGYGLLARAIEAETRIVLLPVITECEVNKDAIEWTRLAKGRRAVDILIWKVRAWLVSES